jgi:hypothetical protein
LVDGVRCSDTVSLGSCLSLSMRIEPVLYCNIYLRSPLYILVVYPYTHAFDRKRKREGEHSEEGTKAEFTHVLMAMLQPFGLDEKPESTQRSSSEQQTRQCLLRRCFAASLNHSRSHLSIIESTLPTCPSNLSVAAPDPGSVLVRSSRQPHNLEVQARIAGRRSSVD